MITRLLDRLMTVALWAVMLYGYLYIGVWLGNVYLGTLLCGVTVLACYLCGFNRRAY